jgi:hypothetical protein
VSPGLKDITCSDKASAEKLIYAETSTLCASKLTHLDGARNLVQLVVS